MTYVAAPLGAYEIVLEKTLEEVPRWAVRDLRLGWKSLMDDFGPDHVWPYMGFRDCVFATRDEALDRGAELAEWHRERHLWWTPDL